MIEYLSLDPKQLSVGALHGYLLAAVAPRPIAFASTIDKDGNVNLAPFSFFNVFSSNPPIMIFSPARSGRDNTTKHTYQNVKEVAEVVINIVHYPIVEQMSLASTAYDKGVNEFVKAGLTEFPSDLVKPPRVKESPVAFECRVNEVVELGTTGGAGNLIISEVLKIHIRKEFLDDTDKLDTTKLDLVGRMGGSWYARASGNALFEIPKPITTRGIGIDQLPEHVRNSTVLTGNNLARLGNQEKLPDDNTIALVWEEYKEILEDNSDNTIVSVHTIARALLQKNEVQKAMSLLMNL